MKTLNATQVTAVALALVLAFTASEAFAGTGGTAFDDVWLTLTDWSQGTLGRIIAGSMVVVGLVGGIARQSIASFAVGIGGGMGLYNTPTVIESVMTSTLPIIASAVEAAGVLPHIG